MRVDKQTVVFAGVCLFLLSYFMMLFDFPNLLTVLFGSTAALQATLSPATAVALLIFCLLYTPCVAAIASVKQELGGKWAVAVAFGQCAIAWVCALIANQICMVVM